MLNDFEPIQVQAQTVDAITGEPLCDVCVEVILCGCKRFDVVGHVSTGANGLAILDLPANLWRQQLILRLAGSADNGIEICRAAMNGEVPIVLEVQPTADLDAGRLAMLADQLIASRRVRADDLVRDLAAPATDSMVRLLTPGERVRLLALLRGGQDHMSVAERKAVTHLLDPQALRDGVVKFVPIRDLPRTNGELVSSLDSALLPSLGWELFPWAKPDDQSYRDYLRSVFVLFAHQQKLGVGADPKLFPDVVERQLTLRFFQNFRTSDRTEVSLNRLLLPLVTAILTAPAAPGLGFGVVAGALPVQGTRTDREQLDALLSLAKVKITEFANRYRLPLTEPDSATSTPVKLNIYTLSRILSDTAQGPVEPNPITPQLPGEEGKPLLWTEVVGSAPFFLRFDEWLARQQPFFAENLFAIRTQVMGAAPTGPWLTERRKRFLDFHLGLPLIQSIKSYDGYFGSMDEVHRSASFLLAYGLADAKLTELVSAIDKGQFSTAWRLADEAEILLRDANPNSKPGEDWEPSRSVPGYGNSRPLSFTLRRKLKVSNITELIGSRDALTVGFEQYFELERPGEQSGPGQWWQAGVGQFRLARDTATRLRTYQQLFLLPMLRASIHAGQGDLVGAVDTLAGVTGFYIGISMLGRPAGMVKVPNPGILPPKRAVDGSLREDHPLGNQPYTARLMYDDQRSLDAPYTLTN